MIPVKTTSSIDPERIALGIQQPWVELILRGIKTIEVRSQPTRVRGRIYLYASRRMSNFPESIEMRQQHQLEEEHLPTGLLLGSVELIDCRPCLANDAIAACVSQERLTGQYAWILGQPERFPKPVAVRFLPYGVWFYPFRRKTS